MIKKKEKFLQQSPEPTELRFNSIFFQQRFSADILSVAEKLEAIRLVARLDSGELAPPLVEVRGAEESSCRL